MFYKAGGNNNVKRSSKLLHFQIRLYRTDAYNKFLKAVTTTPETIYILHKVALLAPSAPEDLVDRYGLCGLTF